MLYLDELHERSMLVPEVMHQLIEQKLITTIQTLDSLTFVSNYQLIAVMNLWACSYYGELSKRSQLIHKTRQGTAYILIIPLLYDLLWKIAEEIFPPCWAVL